MPRQEGGGLKKILKLKLEEVSKNHGDTISRQNFLLQTPNIQTNVLNTIMATAADKKKS
jgi:hypothetical protein